MKFLESFFNVKIYPCYKDKSCLSWNDFKSLNKEIRALAFRTFNQIPEYQCFLENYDAIKDKLLVIHRNQQGELDGFSSSVIIHTQDEQIGDIMHLGIYIVLPEARHQHIQFKLGLAATGAYLGLNRNNSNRWATNLSSVLGTLAIVDKMYSNVYPGLKKEQPDEVHIKIASLFQEGVSERCYIDAQTQFDAQNFVYRKANQSNCFLKKISDKQFYSLNSTANQFYTKIANLDEGDAILQVCKIDYVHFYMAVLAYLYRVSYRDFKLQWQNRRTPNVQTK